MMNSTLHWYILNLNTNNFYLVFIFTTIKGFFLKEFGWKRKNFIVYLIRHELCLSSRLLFIFLSDHILRAVEMQIPALL